MSLTISDLMKQEVWHNRVSDYLIALLIFLGISVCIIMGKAFIVRRLRIWAEKTRTAFDDFLVQALSKTVIPFLYFVALYIAAKSLRLSARADKTLYDAWFGIATICVTGFLISLTRYSLKRYWEKRGIDASRQKSYVAILPALKIVLWSIAVVFLLDNYGVKISTVVAGLGIGGVAVALASQTVLSDLFSYFAILFDRPFEVGDFVTVGDYMGTVEHIGIKTTRIQSLGGEQLVFRNTDLTNSRVQNYKRMQRRRVVSKLGVTYQTTSEQVKVIPTIIKQIIEGIEGVTFDRAHFAAYGDFSLIFEVVYYVMSGDYNQYMDLQQEINFRIKEEFEKRGIEFAYPTQTIFLAK
jgi:small-conductance mechanosensitive channel